MPSIDPDLFGDVCHERDVLLAENRRLKEEIEERLTALAIIRSTWNAHMATCPKHAALPDLPAPSWDDLESWRDAPSGTASA